VLDQEAVTSQVQLIRSRDLARRVADKLDLAALPEYDPKTPNGILEQVMAEIGLARTPSEASVEEHILNRYYKNLQVYAIEKSRVIAVDFSSTDPKLAADAANTIAAEYIAFQREAKRDTTTDATNWLESEISDLRTKVKDAEARVEDFRSNHDLFSSGGQNTTTLSGQQLADLNAELARVRAARAEAQAKADQIRARISSGAALNVTDVLNSQLIQRLVEQQVALRADIAQLSATLLPGHPRMRALRAQLDDLDQQVNREARKILDSLESEAKLAEGRESEIQKNLGELKVTAATAGDATVQLRALEREAAAQRDLLDTYLRRYREALARQNGDYLPADARIISRAAVPVDPDFPKKVPMTAAVTIAALILSIAFILIRELATGRSMRRVEYAAPVPQAPVVAAPTPVPVGGHVRWADDHGVRRIMPNEPTLVPEIPDEVEESLAVIARRIIAEERRRVLVTLADGSDLQGRPLAAAALARAISKDDKRVVLVDLRGDGANTETMGDEEEAPGDLHDLPGFADLLAGDASFAQVIFRDRKSRAHFIPAGRHPPGTDAATAERMATIFSALDHTYDHLVIDAGDELIAAVAPACAAAMVVTEFGASDPRTVRAVEKVSAVSNAAVLLLVVDPAPKSERGQAAEAAPAGEAA
jgi:uncharacterized protein involved in exopolysaccharide biosynthesis/Mrp family chromosome partitioning ATPase